MEFVRETFIYSNAAPEVVVDEDWSPTKLANDHSLNIEAEDHQDANQLDSDEDPLVQSSASSPGMPKLAIACELPFLSPLAPLFPCRENDDKLILSPMQLLVPRRTVSHFVGHLFPR